MLSFVRSITCYDYKSPLWISIGIIQARLVLKIEIYLLLKSKTNGDMIFQEVIDTAGKANFFKAIGVASQVFNTLTEVIQGPCTSNQQALAHSRLWDAVLHITHILLLPTLS